MGQRAVRIIDHDPRVWRPPAGWVLAKAGVWLPADYQPTRWEMPAPAIYNDRDAEIDWLKCRKSLAYFLFTWGWTLDVDDPQGIAVRKFPAYGYLRRAAHELQDPDNVHIEKSRQMIMSWFLMGVFVWDSLFKRRFSGLVLSKRSADVDDGGINATPNSNFGKFKFIADHLPEHLWAYVEYKKFMISVPSTRSTIKGETGKGGMAARGPTYKRALMDEAAYVDRSETVFKGIRQAAKKGTILNSTPNGKGNVFARIRFSNTTTFKKVSFHWSEHPRKAVGLYCICGWKATPGNGTTPAEQYREHARACPKLLEGKSPQMRSPWYDTQAADLTEEQIASELDISYEKSRRGRVYTKFDQTRNVWEVTDYVGPRGVDEAIEDYHWRYLLTALKPEYQTFVTWDFGVNEANPTVMLLGQIIDDTIPIIRFVDEIEKSDESYEYFGNIVNTFWLPALQAVGNPHGIVHYGDPAGKQRGSNLMSWITNLATMGIALQTIGQGDLLEWVDFINDQYNRGNVQISDFCDGLITATENYHYPTDDQGNPIPGKPLPVHDEWSHKMDAKRYLYKMRYSAKLTNRRGRGVPRRRVLARGAGYDRRTETQQF